MIARILTGCLGLAALAWVLAASQVFVRSSPLEGFADQIIAGDVFSADALAGTASQLEDVPPSGPEFPPYRHARAILRLRLLETSLDKADSGADARMNDLGRELRSSLSLAPADPFLWLTLCWLQNLQEGLQPSSQRYLAFSYELGPLEGWIAQKRNRLALVMFASLGPEVQRRTITEFAGMVDSGLLFDAAINLVGPGWTIRDRLLASLADVDLAAKQAFSKMLGRRGYRVKIPGLPEDEERPWQ